MFRSELPSYKRVLEHYEIVAEVTPQVRYRVTFVTRFALFLSTFRQMICVSSFLALFRLIVRLIFRLSFGGKWLQTHKERCSRCGLVVLRKKAR